MSEEREQSMKSPFHRRKAEKSLLRGRLLFQRSVLFLSALLIFCSLAPAALGEETPSALSEGGADPLPPFEQEEPAKPSEENSLFQEAPLPSEPAGPEATPCPDAACKEAEEGFFTVTFDMGSLGKKVYSVPGGEYLSQMPEDPVLPCAVFLGWYDREGAPASPDCLPITEDMTFWARFSRNLSDLLNTYDHIAYIGGYENGMFKPQKSITRAEAAKMFYTLLLDQGLGTKEFSDVPSGKWYTEPVGAAAYLGVVSGYPDGTFRANRHITRAEFVKIAVSFDTLEQASVSFTDVKKDSWAYPYIATAYQKGWITGFEDGTFRPNAPITRAQAVTILNKMLGRTPDEQVKEWDLVKNFYDVFPSHWAYGQIEEAATAHSYYMGSAGETWTSFEEDHSQVESSRWVIDGKDHYYLDAETRKFLRGKTVIDGVTYLLDDSTGKAVTGFRKVGSWRRYYRHGLIVDDISDLGVTHGPYFIKVYKPSNYLIIFAKDESGIYNTPVTAMRVSCGFGTPTGTYYTPDRYRWLQMIGDTWAQWCTQIQGNYLFHSVPNWTYNNFDLEVEEYNHLGETRSLGCIRLNCRDAKWIFDHCALGTQVLICASETGGPLKKPAGITIPAWHTWDPTDPTASYRCKQLGCH